MAIVRTFIAALLALLVTVGLLGLMSYMIFQNLEEPKDQKVFNIPDILMPKRQIETVADEIDQNRPDKNSEPPPELPEQDMSDPQSSVAVQSVALNGDLSLGEIEVSMGGGGDLILLVAPPPRYPSSALSRRLQGNCVVEFRVNEAGETENADAVQCTNKVFASASERAVKKYKYKPRMIDGKPSAVERVRQTIKFEMASE